MIVTLWGVRGDIPTPINTREYRDRLVEGLDQAREVWQSQPDLAPEAVLEKLPVDVSDLLGGETNCVEVRAGDNFVIVDMGTGARMLGYDIMKRGHKGDLHILMSGTRWDHMQGWPFFIPGYLPTNHAHFYTAYANAHERFVRQQVFDHFPVEFDQMVSKRDFHRHDFGTEFGIGPFKISLVQVSDAGDCAYAIEHDGKRCIVAHNVHYKDDAFQKRESELKDFFMGADLLVLNLFDRSVQGNLPATRLMELLEAWNVKELVLVHFRPSDLDRSIRQRCDEIREKIQGSGITTSIHPGMEGDSFDL